MKHLALTPRSLQTLEDIQKQALGLYSERPVNSHVLAEYRVNLFWNDDLGNAAIIQTNQDWQTSIRGLLAATTPTTPKGRLFAHIQKRHVARHHKHAPIGGKRYTMESIATFLAMSMVILCLLFAAPSRPESESIQTEVLQALKEFHRHPHHRYHHHHDQKQQPIITNDGSFPTETSGHKKNRQICQDVTVPSTKPRRCFTTHDELRKGVLLYSRNPLDRQSNVAKMYGWPIGAWCVSYITDFSRIFKYSTMNEPIDQWDVSNAKTMERIFYGARHMNQNLTSWNVEKVKNFREAFAGATNFTGDISTWNVAKARDMSGMFDQAVSFSSNLAAWNVAKVKNMQNMFRGTVKLNADLSRWNTGNVSNMASMFRGSGIAGGLSAWPLSKVTRMDFMFEGASHFNGDLSHWDVSAVTTVRGMFLDATSFSSNLCSWGKKLPHKADAHRMFEYAVSCPAPNKQVVLAGPVPSPLCHVCL